MSSSTNEPNKSAFPTIPCRQATPTVTPHRCLFQALTSCSSACEHGSPSLLPTGSSCPSALSGVCLCRWGSSCRRSLSRYVSPAPPCLQLHFPTLLPPLERQVVEVAETYDAGDGNGNCAIVSSYAGVPLANVTDGCTLDATTGEVQYNGGGYIECNVTLTVPEDMASPVYVYYQLDNFYQNHRRYVKSRDDAQLSGGKVVASGELAACDPLVKATLPYGCGERTLHPCGLIANSMFNGGCCEPASGD